MKQGTGTQDEPPTDIIFMRLLGWEIWTICFKSVQKISIFSFFQGHDSDKGFCQLSSVETAKSEIPNAEWTIFSNVKYICLTPILRPFLDDIIRQPSLSKFAAAERNNLDCAWRGAKSFNWVSLLVCKLCKFYDGHCTKCLGERWTLRVGCDINCTKSTIAKLFSRDEQETDECTGACRLWPSWHYVICRTGVFLSPPSLTTSGLAANYVQTPLLGDGKRGLAVSFLK